MIECLASAAIALPSTLPHSERLEHWLNKGFNADMAWMANTAEIRKHPTSFNGKTYNAVWIALWKYPRPLQKKHEPIAAYSHGKDYHISILKELLAKQIEGQPFVDALPIAERELAAMAGLGFIGKNTMLINPKFGSAFFIGGILLNKKNPPIPHTPYPIPNTHSCAKCNRCIDACPSNALTEDGFLDARKCASYLTIEHKGEFSEEQKEWAKHSIFGCDICQRVCPYNARHLAETEPYFAIEESEWKKKTIKETPLWRTGTKRLKRNAENYWAAFHSGVCLPPAFARTLATSGNVEPTPIASAQSIGV
ncbi:epoxyqueuosine reductase [Fibrobacteria bacterium R8-3-H12]